MFEREREEMGREKDRGWEKKEMGRRGRWRTEGGNQRVRKGETWESDSEAGREVRREEGKQREAGGKHGEGEIRGTGVIDVQISSDPAMYRLNS